MPALHFTSRLDRRAAGVFLSLSVIYVRRKQALQTEQSVRLQGVGEETGLTLVSHYQRSTDQTGKQSGILAAIFGALKSNLDSLYCHRNATCQKPPSWFSKQSYCVPAKLQRVLI